MSSIVERLASRSVSGRDLGIAVHKHTNKLLHFYWKKCGTERCYTLLLERALLEEEEFTLIKDCIFKAGFSGACECLVKGLPVPDGRHFCPCPFWTRGHIFHQRGHLSTRLMREFEYCRCPEVYHLGCKGYATVTIFCLDKHSQVSSKFPHTAMDWIRSRSVLLPATRVLGL